MNRIDRLFAIHTYLQSRRHVPAEAIADKFSISVRTVYRDVKALCEAGVPISFEPTKGYFIVQGYFLPPVSFTTEEAAALMLMEGATRIFADRGIQQHYAAALTKVRAVLKGPQQDRIEALTGSIGMQLPSCMEATYDHLPALQEAIAQRTILELDYCTKAEEYSTRQVEPIGLMFYALSWHLIAWCHLRLAYRDFKVSRIQAIRNTSRPFTIQQHITLAEFTANLPVDF